MGVLRFGPCAGAAPGQSHPDDFGHSSFATVRHRTVRWKGCLSNKTALAMIFKLAEAAEKSWRRLDGHNQLPKIILGVKTCEDCRLAGIGLPAPHCDVDVGRIDLERSGFAPRA